MPSDAVSPRGGVYDPESNKAENAEKLRKTGGGVAWTVGLTHGQYLNNTDHVAIELMGDTSFFGRMEQDMIRRKEIAHQRETILQRKRARELDKSKGMGLRTVGLRYIL